MTEKLSDDFESAVRTEWTCGMPLNINDSTTPLDVDYMSTHIPRLRQDFGYHGYTDKEAGQCIGEIFQGRVDRGKYDPLTHCAYITCTKQPSNDCGLQQFGHHAYKCKFSVDQRQ
jgi:hypothetical protein